MSDNNYPKLHNATWPGLVGKARCRTCHSFRYHAPMTAEAEVNGVRFDGVDLGLMDPHINIVNSTDDDIKRLADKVAGYNLKIGSLVAPIWGGPAMGSRGTAHFVEMVRKACQFGQRLRELGFGLMEWCALIRLVLPKAGRLIPLIILNFWSRPSGKLATWQLISAKNWRPKEKFAGEACTVGVRW